MATHYCLQQIPHDLGFCQLNRSISSTKDLLFSLWVRFFFIIISFTTDFCTMTFSNSFHNVQKEYRNLLETLDTKIENC